MASRKTSGSSRSANARKTTGSRKSASSTKTSSRTASKATASSRAGSRSKVSRGSASRSGSSRPIGTSTRGTQSKAGPAKSSHPLTDHDEIRQWAEERGATPSCVIGTGGKGDIGMIRLDFPGYSGEGSLQEISWDEWFEKFDENGLALMVQDATSRGQKSNFNKLVKRTAAQNKPRARSAG